MTTQVDPKGADSSKPSDGVEPVATKSISEVGRDMTPFNYRDDLGTNEWMRKLGFTWKLNEIPNQWNDGNWAMGDLLVSQRQARLFFGLVAKPRLAQRIKRALRRHR